MEFTQFHDVYYNTGESAEAFDLQCKNFRDCMVGPSRETESTFSAIKDTARIKVGMKKHEEKSKNNKSVHNLHPVRSSPRKKTAMDTAKIKHPVEKSNSGYNKQSFQNAIHPNRVKDKNLKDARNNQQSVQDGNSSLLENSKLVKRRSGGGGDGVDLSEVNKKKLRVAVYEALLGKKIGEKDELFRPCFSKLFNICKMYVLECDEE